MRKISLFILFIIATSAVNAQLGYTVVKSESFESPDFTTDFSISNSLLNNVAVAFTRTGCTSTYWQDMYCDATTKDVTLNIVNSDANSGSQSLKVYIGSGAQANTTSIIRIRANNGAFGYDGTTNLTGTTANTIGAWTNYLITFYAKTDAGDPAEGNAVFKNNQNLLLTSSWKKFYIASTYQNNTNGTNFFINFKALSPAAGYTVYLDDIKVLKTVQPTTNSATNVTTSSFSANWTAVPDATSYSVTVEKSDGGSTPVWTGINGSPFTVSSNSLDVTGLDASSTYRYKFTASDGVLTSIASTTTQVTTSSLTGLENPVVGSVYVENNKIIVNSLISNKITLYNATGQKIYSGLVNEGINRITLNSHGIFIVKVGNETHKVIL